MVVFFSVPGMKPQYEQPGSGLGVLLLVSVLSVRLVVLLGIVLNVRVMLLLSLVLLSLLLLVLEHTTPAGQVPLLELLLEVLLVVVVCSRSVSVCSVVRWRTSSSPIPAGRLNAVKVNAIARIRDTAIVGRPSLDVIRIAHYGYVSCVIYECCSKAPAQTLSLQLNPRM
jgi:hypothetical protein